MKKLCWVAAAFLFSGILFLSGRDGSLAVAFGSLVLLIFLCVTAFPIARMLFSEFVAALLFSFPIGFVLHSFLLSICAKLCGISALSLAIYLLLWSILCLALLKSKRLTVAVESEWNTTDSLLLLLWLVLTLVAVALPFANVGARTAQGLAYRAYFNADFFRNLAVVGSLFQQGVPPDNPYFGGRELHYYWFFHVVLSYWRTFFTSYRPDLLLVQFSLFAICLFVMSLFYTVREFVVSRKTLLLLFPVILLGGSYKGVYLLHVLSQKNLPWDRFTAWNVDGILRWVWNVPQIDTIYRALLYAPQHLIVLALFFAALSLWTRPIGFRQRTVLCLLLFSSIGLSTFIGGTLVLTGGSLMLYNVAKRKNSSKDLVIWFVTGFIFLAIYFFTFRMFDPSSQTVLFGLHPKMLQHVAAYLLFNWGPLLILGLGGIILYPSRFPHRILVSLLLFCLFLVFFVRINLPGESDISLKLGHFTNVILILLTAAFLDRMLQRPRLLLGGLLILLVPASLSWVLDSYNSRDVSNARFTTYVSVPDVVVLNWMRANLPERSVILNYSRDYEDFIFDEVPPLAERSVYLGDRIFSSIFQVPPEEFEGRKKIVSAIFRAETGEEAREICRRAGISHVFFSSRDALLMRDARQILTRPYFSLLIQEGDACVFRRE